MNLQVLLQLILACLTVAKSYTKTKDAVLLSKVRSLTLQNHKQTTARRVTAIPQLACVGGNAKKLYEVDVMQCTNSGSEYDAEDIQWTCRANLPPEFKLGSTEVVCEGFDSSEDPYVLKGSCGVEYRLVLTQMGEEKYGTGGWFKSRPKESSSPKTEKSSQSFGSGTEKPSQSWGSMLFTVVFWTAFIGMSSTNHDHAPVANSFSHCPPDSELYLPAIREQQGATVASQPSWRRRRILGWWWRR